MTVWKKYEDELREAVGHSKTLLDVGCGDGSPIQYFAKDIHTVGVDAFAGSLEKSASKGIHKEYIKMNILEIGQRFEPDSFDCVIASDVIEHLSKPDGVLLLNRMESIARKRVIIFTPNGFLPQGEYDQNPWQVHLSGWTVQDFKARGYRVLGMRGMKPLRGPYAAIRFWPTCFWLQISNFSQRIVRHRPDWAFQLLAIKDKW